MSSAFTPPDSLSKDDRRTIADVRRAIWINGFLGLGAGTVAGMVGHLTLQKLQRKYVTGDGVAAARAASDAGWMHKCLRHLPPLGRNTFLLSLLGGGALGSFVLSTTAGEYRVPLDEMMEDHRTRSFIELRGNNCRTPSRVHKIYFREECGAFAAPDLRSGQG